MQRLKIGLDKAGLNAKHFDWPPKNEPDRAPYHGLKAMEEADAGIFFGRDGQIINAMDKLRGVRDAAPPRMMVILGASGAGKSSFMRAGLLPRLAREDRHFLPLPIIRPEKSVITGETGFLNALETAFQSLGLSKSKADIRECLANGLSRTANLLQELVDAAAKKSLSSSEEGATPPTLIISIDQGEELFLTDGAEEADQFLTLLSALMLDDKPAITTLFTIRSDSYDALQTAKQLEGITQQTNSLLPMPKGVYQEVITGPAKRQTEAGNKLEVEDALVQQLLTDIEQGGAKDALPLLAFTLERLYDEYSGEGALKLAGYQALGGIKGAIVAGVKQAFKKADDNPAIPKDVKQREALLRRGLIPWVAGIDPDTGSPRRRVANLGDIPIKARPLMDLLVEQRLLAKDISTKTGEVTIEPAHEALLRQWSLLEGWLEEDFENLSVLEGIKRAALDWASNGEDTEWLSHTGGRLETATTILGERQDLAENLTSDERTYLETCREKGMGEKQKEFARLKREKRRNRIIAYGSLVASLVMAVLGWQVYGFWQKAEQQKFEAVAARKAAQLSETKHLTKQVNVMLDQKEYGSRPTLFAMEALPNPKSLDENIRTRPSWHLTNLALSRAEKFSAERKIFEEHEGAINSVFFSADSQYFVSGSNDNTVRLWSVATGAELKRFEGHKRSVTSVAFSADSQYLVSGSWDRTVRLWSVSTGVELKRLEGHVDDILSVAFSADGQYLVSGSKDSTVRLWSVITGKELKSFQVHGHVVSSVAFSADGQYLVSGSSDNTVRLWSVSTGVELKRFEGHEDFVSSVVFSVDGQYLVSGSRDKTVRLWSLKTGDEQKRFEEHEGAINSVFFSADGQYLVSGSSDNTVRLWSVATGKELKRFEGHVDEVLSVAFSTDGQYLVSGSSDNTVRLWSVATGAELKRFEGHKRSVTSVAFSADGQYLVSGSWDRTVRLWSVNTGKEKKRFEGGGSRINSVAFSTDGQYLVSGAKDSTVQLWSIATGKELKSFQGHGHVVNSVAFSADGQYLVSGSSDSTVRLWSVITGKELKSFQGHEYVVSSVAFSADGQYLVSGSWDNTVRLWSVSTGVELKRFEGHESYVSSVAFSADGRTLISGSYDKTIKTWVFPKYIYLEKAQSLIPRCLTQAERKAYFLSAVPPRWCITGVGRERETDSTKWQPKYPYHTAAWKKWLIAKDEGKEPALPTK